MVKLSVIIVSYNTRDVLMRCLESVFAHTEGLVLEVIVVDNNSIDGSPTMVEETFPAVTLIRNKANIGFAAANNVGLRSASGEFILFLNSDTVVVHDALRKSVSHLLEHPEVGILGCKLLNADGSIQPSARDFPTLWSLFLESLFVYRVLPHRGVFRNPWITDLDTEQQIDIVKGAFLLTRRSVLDDVGPLDERFFLYSEEQDWCLRANQRGWKAIYWPHAEVFHLDGASTNIALNSRRFLIYDSETEYFRKHFGRAYATVARTLMVIGILSRLVLWTLAAGAAHLFSGRSSSASLQARRYWYALRWCGGWRGGTV